MKKKYNILYISNSQNIKLDDRFEKNIEHTLSEIDKYVTNELLKINNLSIEQLPSSINKIINSMPIVNLLNFQNGILTLRYSRYISIEYNIISFIREVKLNKLLKNE